jgi:3-phosphoshikimate 1-carboxyvinyltransferase
MLAPVITIDGPTASGKGTVALGVSQSLAWRFLDSGALYRLTALSLWQKGYCLEDVEENASEELRLEAAELAETLDTRFDARGAWLNGELVSEEIRQEMIGMMASKVSAWPGVRSGLLALQHDFRRAPGLVADGRDMGTVVFTDAPLKVFLTADARVRAERRHKQLIDKGISVKIESLLDDLAKRDAQDMQRSIAPLKPAPDAVLLDTSEMNVAQAIDWVLKKWSLLQSDEQKK